MTEAREPRLLDALFSPGPVGALLSDRARVQRMLDFEAALARAEAAVGVIPRAASIPIGRHCGVERFDLAELARGTALAGNVAIPLVRMLTAHVAADDVEASKYVHWGATSQDAIDSGLVLQLRDVLDVLEADLARFDAALLALCVTHRSTVQAGRTWMQQATPVTLGLKLAGWLSAVRRHRERLRELRPRLLVVQLGGATGTLAAIGPRALDVVTALARELDLAAPDLPWHTQRDRVAEVATTLGLLAGSLGKMARDVALSMQTEVGETFEPAAPGRGGSSTMPHKRNPVGSAVVLAAALRVPALVSVMLGAMVQEHERGLGHWHAEWETLPEIAALTAGALTTMVGIAEGLEVDAERMTRNLDLTDGLILAEAVTMALGPQLGRGAAHRLVEHACRQAVDQRRTLRSVLGDAAAVTAHLSADELDRLLDPPNYTGLAAELVDRVTRGG